jgi:hypothetical protein
VKSKTNLSDAILLQVLLLNGGAEVKSGVVNEIGRVLGQIQQHEIEVQPNHTKPRK